MWIAYHTAVSWNLQDSVLDTVMCPKGRGSDIFFPAVCLTKMSALSLDTRAQVSGKHSSFLTEGRVPLYVG
jgi:hypothetical protein